MDAKPDVSNLTDAIGHLHSIVDWQQGPPRIVSLVPSITELLCDLSLAPWLVGRTGFCVHPAVTVASIAKIGGTKDVNIEKIRALAPTHLIVNIDENEKPTVESLAQHIPHVVVTHPLKPTDNPPLYRLLGTIFDVKPAAERLCEAFEREHQALLTLPPSKSRTVLYCIWKDPWMTVSQNTYIAAMLELIGWHHWRADENGVEITRYPQFTWQEMHIEEIDEVLLSSEPYRFAEAHVEALMQQLGKPVRLLDGEMLSWYGSRAIQGLRYLRELKTAAASHP